MGILLIFKSLFLIMEDRLGKWEFYQVCQSPYLFFINGLQGWCKTNELHVVEGIPYHISPLSLHFFQIPECKQELLQGLSTFRHSQVTIFVDIWKGVCVCLLDLRIRPLLKDNITGYPSCLTLLPSNSFIEYQICVVYI